MHTLSVNILLYIKTLNFKLRLLKLYRKCITPLQQSVSFQETAFYHIVVGLFMSTIAVKITTKDLKAK